MYVRVCICLSAAIWDTTGPISLIFYVHIYDPDTPGEYLYYTECFSSCIVMQYKNQ